MSFIHRILLGVSCVLMLGQLADAARLAEVSDKEVEELKTDIISNQDLDIELKMKSVETMMRREDHKKSFSLELDDPLSKTTKTLSDMLGIEVGGLIQKLNADPLDISTMLRLADLYLQGNRPDRAAEMYYRAASIAPDNYKAVAGMGSAMLGLGDNENAFRILSRAAVVLPLDYQLHFNLASACYRTKRYNPAEKLFAKLLSKDPQNPKTLYNLAAVKIEQGDESAAVNLLLQAHAAQPQNPFAMLFAARIHSRSNQKPEMVTALKKVKPLMSHADFLISLQHQAFSAWQEDEEFKQLLQPTSTPLIPALPKPE